MQSVVTCAPRPTRCGSRSSRPRVARTASSKKARVARRARSQDTARSADVGASLRDSRCMTRKQTEDGEGSGEAKEPASQVYGGMVADIIEGTPRDSDWRPAQPMELRIVRRRAPQSVDELEPEEREQLAALVFPEKLETVLSPGYVVEDFPLGIEVAAVRTRAARCGFGSMAGTSARAG